FARFHSLGEFDEGKRSCRKRLDGHNRGRRKPQPDSLSLSSARLFSDHQGTRYLRFGSSQVFPTSAATSAWAETVKAENSTLDFINNRSLHNPVIDSDGALSLLSSLPLREATPEIGSSHVVHLQAASQSSVPSLSYDHDGCLGMKTEPIGSVLVSNNISHVFQIEPDDVGSSGSGHTLSFSWQ
ncbi:Squamosa promoter-binding-like protein 13B, partial [Linum grandiflorum]